MEVTIKGEVYENQGVKKVGKKSFEVCKVIIKTDGKYPQHIPIDFSGEGLSLASSLSVGKEVEVKGYVNGRMWDGGEKGIMYFLSIKGVEVNYSSGNPSPSTDIDDDDLEDAPF